MSRNTRGHSGRRYFELKCALPGTSEKKRRSVTALPALFVSVRKLGVFSWVHHSEGAATLAPDEYKRILSCRYVRQDLLNILSGVHRLAIHRQDDVAARNS